MQLFKCQHCSQFLYFENTQCLNCGHQLGYSWETNTLLSLTETTPNRWRSIHDAHREYAYCANAAYGACNWLMPAGGVQEYCLACQLNQTVPDLGQPEFLALWQKMEIAKHRLVYSLLRLDLPVISHTDDPAMGLAFDFLADNATPYATGEPVTTGHDQGVITINIIEADDAKREEQRQSLAEPYRTLLGHFRHEIAHYYWQRMAQNFNWLEAFRSRFGDDRHDYGQALAQHYAAPPTTDWMDNYISAYASSHPWEDWAETWAHYLHIIDTLETAYAFGMRLQPERQIEGDLNATVDFDAYRQNDFDILIDTWLPVTFALNSLNRAMGQPDLYPFVLTKPVLEKMRFIHHSIHTFHQL